VVERQEATEMKKAVIMKKRVEVRNEKVFLEKKVRKRCTNE
jgi:hypothetical protein